MSAGNENFAPHLANIDAGQASVAAGPLKRSAEEGDGEPAPKRSRMQAWFGGPVRALSALGIGCGALLTNIRAVPVDSAPTQHEQDASGVASTVFDTATRTSQAELEQENWRRASEEQQQTNEDRTQEFARRRQQAEERQRKAEEEAKKELEWSRHLAQQQWSQRKAEEEARKVKIDPPALQQPQGRPQALQPRQPQIASAAGAPATAKSDKNAHLRPHKEVRFEDTRVQQSFSDLLRLQPKEEVHFIRGTSVAMVTLSNISQGCVAFKFKASTTACLARPTSGTLRPGEHREVRLSLGAIFGTQAVREKYLVQAMAVQSPAVLSRDEWAAMGRASVHDARFVAVRDAA